MTLDVARLRPYLQRFDFGKLFVEELGWDRHSARREVSVDGQILTLTAIAEKRGFVVFSCPPQDDGHIPDYATRAKVEKEVARSTFEHLIIYVDGGRTTQIWQWVKREAGKPVAPRQHIHHRDRPGDALIQKLQALAFSLEEEESLAIVDVSGRVRAAFDLERVTKRFYDRFKTEHDAFLGFLRGIPDAEMQRWYVSVMLNRLMFIYFIQKKGFLDGDPNYLRNQLVRSRQRGADLFYSSVLCPLFFEGFAKNKDERSREINQLLGRVPYLNGGLFMRHQIEETHGAKIRIADAAFERLFGFFEQYQWHLDERPLRKDNEINPDVLGYIFEKYINQKQMGAYYTKEDITEYIGKNTVIPYLFDVARQKCRIAFEGDHSVWRLLQADPDRYIYPAVKKGVKLSLPDEIAAGLDDVARRAEWNKPAPEEYALPTEIWREVVARRNRYQEARAKMAAGEITSVNDLITYNLDIRQFAQDVIVTCEGPELLRAFYRAIEEVTVLDPTCGSGAFLFAALNILDPLYEACLERMEAFVEELDRSGEKHHPEKYGDFRRILRRVDDHPNRRYFILKSIIINNLFGVDIMEEAVEICKLRLFLKLVAQIERVGDIEPLPDIDFNIRAGNTLVGYATYEDVRRAVSGEAIGQYKLQFDNAMQRIDEKAQDVDRLFGLFRQQQTELGGDVASADKRELRTRLKALEDDLNGYLAGEYNVSRGANGKSPAYERWLTSHQPFHWFIEFYGIMKNGGFDVVIGNPPYVESNKVKQDYSLRGYQVASCGNLYAFTLERTIHLLAENARTGMIVPLSLVSTERMSPLQDLLANNGRSIWLSSFDVYPCKLFEGAKQRLTILLAAGKIHQPCILTTVYQRWKPQEREQLFQNLSYWPSQHNRKLSVIPKLQHGLGATVLRKLSGNELAVYLDSSYRVSFHVHRIPYNYIKAFDFIPYFWNAVDGEKKSEDYKPYCLRQQTDERVVLAILNSNLFFWWWYTLFEGYHCGRHEIHAFPVGLNRMSVEHRQLLNRLADELMQDVMKNKRTKTCEYKHTGKVAYEEFYPRLSKPIIDEIDRALARHYGFTDEEMDFIINYDIKYRMGRENPEGDEEVV